MSIIRYSKDGATVKYAYLNLFPDQFKTDSEKSADDYVKGTMDYFANRAYAEYVKNRETFVKNYDLVKGILRMEDFYQEPEVKSFTEILTQSVDLPAYVKHYSIITTPLNELIGEMTKRPDTYKVKAFDDDSKSEELQYKTDVLREYIMNEAKRKIFEKAASEGIELTEEDLEQKTFDEVKDEIDSYTSIAEKWGNHILTAMKAEFNLKEKSEDAFSDLLKSAREYYHIYEDNSRLGFNIDAENPKYVWVLTTPDKKYTSDVTGRAQGAYAAGTVKVMELSEIIETFPDLTKDEIDHLRKGLEDYGLIDVRESNLGRNVTPGIDSITYDTYDPLVLQTRMMIESEMKDNDDGLRDFLGLTSNVSSFGYKYVVVRAYWISKRKVGKLVYTDELGNLQSLLVDENYKSGTIPTQISLDWGWVNQMYQGVKIGPDVYHMKPFNLLPYIPIIGTVFEIKNTEARSLVDMMKPFQTLYNIAMNQLYRLLEKEIGNVGSINIRRIPKLKDGDDQDALDMWEMEARERGIVFDDDSPENTKAPVTNTSVAKNIDLTRTNEIQSRYNLAIQMKNECWELVGMSKQRLGSTSPSESATGVNAAIQQSYSQTEPLFIAHEYVMGQLYQSIIDAALYIESEKDESTLSYITSEGESAFVRVNGTDIRFRDLKVFLTNRAEDTQMFNEIRQLSQAVLQNGGTLYDIIELYSTKSLRQLKKTFKDLKDKMLKQQEDAQQLEQQKIEQAQQQHQETLAQQEAIRKEEIANENYQKELDRISKEKIAIIQATGFGQTPSEDTNANNVPDPLEISRLTMEQDRAAKDYSLKMQDIASKNEQANKKLEIEKEKIKVARENMKNDIEIAKLNAKNRSKKK